MPTPHNYTIESIGSLRGATRYTSVGESTPAWVRLDREGDCPPGFDPTTQFSGIRDMDEEVEGVQGSPATRCGAYLPYPVGTAGYYMDRTPQIVGPHAGAKISFVRGLGERYSNTTLAGSVIPTTEPDKKVVPLDLFPTGLIDSVQVSKSYSPDRSAEFAGGLVQIVPMRLPVARSLNMSFERADVEIVLDVNRHRVHDRLGILMNGREFVHLGALPM